MPAHPDHLATPVVAPARPPAPAPALRAYRRLASAAFALGGLIVWALSSGLSSRPATAAGERGPVSTYSLEAGSELLVRVYRDRSTLLSGMSHDHVIRAKLGGFEVEFRADAPRLCRADFHIPVSSLLVDEAAVRKRLGLSSEFDADDRKSVRENMLAEGQLDAARFPELHVVVSGCRPARTSKQFEADLEFKLRGRAHRARATLFSRDDEIWSRGTLRLTHRQLGMTPYSAFLGVVKNAEPIDVTWRVRARLNR